MKNTLSINDFRRIWQSLLETVVAFYPDGTREISIARVGRTDFEVNVFDGETPIFMDSFPRLHEALAAGEAYGADWQAWLAEN